jgi:hypothetical protein
LFAIVENEIGERKAEETKQKEAAWMHLFEEEFREWSWMQPQSKRTEE